MPLLPNDPANYDINTVLTIANNILNFVTIAAGSAAIIAFIYGAIMYFTGSMTGEKDSKGASGKKIVMAAITGVVIILLARVIVGQVLAVLMPAQPVDVNNPQPTTATTPNSTTSNTPVKTNPGTTPTH
jgi:hypothetical protein